MRPVNRLYHGGVRTPFRRGGKKETGTGQLVATTRIAQDLDLSMGRSRVGKKKPSPTLIELGTREGSELGRVDFTVAGLRTRQTRSRCYQASPNLTRQSSRR